MIVKEIVELKPPRFNQKRFAGGLDEVRKSIEGANAEMLIAWYQANGREKDKSVSKAVNSVIMSNLEARGWQRDWSFCPSVSSNHSTFEAAKEVPAGGGLRFALDVGSRHSNEALGYLVKGQLGAKSRGNELLKIDAHILLTYTDECLKWGGWHSSIYSHQKLLDNLPLMRHMIEVPIWVFAIDPPKNLSIGRSIAGTLKLEKL